MEENKMQITIKISEVSNKFFRHLDETIRCVTLLHNAIDNYDLETELPLPTDKMQKSWDKCGNKIFRNYRIHIREEVVN